MTAPPPDREEGSAARTGTVPVTVVVEEAHRSALDAVCARLRDEGMHVEQVLELLGLVTGRLPQDRLPAVRHLDGVSSVEVQRGYRLPPPGAPVQ